MAYAEAASESESNSSKILVDGKVQPHKKITDSENEKDSEKITNSNIELESEKITDSDIEPESEKKTNSVKKTETVKLKRSIAKKTEENFWFSFLVRIVGFLQIYAAMDDGRFFIANALLSFGTFTDVLFQLWVNIEQQQCWVDDHLIRDSKVGSGKKIELSCRKNLDIQFQLIVEFINKKRFHHLWASKT